MNKITTMNNVAAGFSLRYILCNNCKLHRLKAAATALAEDINLII